MVPRLFLALSMVLIAFGARLSTASAANGIPISHFYMIMEENTDYNDIVGNTADAPYINSLINTYGFAANYYGVTHPSLPNYVATIAGDTFGSTSDSASQQFSAQNLVDQLEAHGLTWAGYMQSMPSAGYTGQTGSGGLYLIRHDPFALMTDIVNDPARMAHVKPASELPADLASQQAPNFTFIAPDVCHDMHGMGLSSAAAVGEPWCAYPPDDVIAHALIQQGDAYLKSLVTTIMTSPAWTSDSAIFVTWDEGDYAGVSGNLGYSNSAGCCSSPPGNGGGRVPAIVITGTPSHTVSLQPYNHYSFLKTVQTAFGLPCLAKTCDADVQPMTDLFGGTSAPTTTQAVSAVQIGQTRGVSITFTSTVPGRGMILFGPTCNSLVMTATRDFGAGTTTHTVLVTGNDMPGTIGDIGLSPGATYYYEAVTSTATGPQIDNNNGACYSFTISKPA